MAFVTDKKVVVSKYLSVIRRMKERDIRTNGHALARKSDFSPCSRKVHYVMGHILCTVNSVAWTQVVTFYSRIPLYCDKCRWIGHYYLQLLYLGNRSYASYRFSFFLAHVAFSYSWLSSWFLSPNFFWEHKRVVTLWLWELIASSFMFPQGVLYLCSLQNEERKHNKNLFGTA